MSAARDKQTGHTMVLCMSAAKKNNFPRAKVAAGGSDSGNGWGISHGARTRSWGGVIAPATGTVVPSKTMARLRLPAAMMLAGSGFTD